MNILDYIQPTEKAYTTVSNEALKLAEQLGVKIPDLSQVQTTAQQASAAQVLAPKSDFDKYLPWAIGALVGVGGLLLVSRAF